MSNTHQEKYISKLLVGIGFLTAGIFTIFFAVFEKGAKEDWYFWGILAAVTANIGVVLIGSAFVHKVKSDLIRRQKQREQHKTFTAD